MISFILFTLLFGYYSFAENILTCEFGGECLPFFHLNSTFFETLETKNCTDMCVYFQCIIDDGKVMRGSGCYDDFTNVCKFIDPLSKVDIYEAIKKDDLEITFESKINFLRMDNTAFINEEKFSFAACHYDNCSIIEFEKELDLEPLKLGENQNTTFSGTCDFDDTPKLSLASVTCNHGGTCMPFMEFKIAKERDEPIIFNLTSKKCNACVQFKCVVDNEKVMIGYGCPEDFENVCKHLLLNVKTRIQKNIKDYFHYSRSLIFLSCSDVDNCALNGVEKYKSDYSNFVKFGDYDDLSYSNSCSYDASPKPLLKKVYCEMGGICLSSEQHLRNQNVDTTKFTQAWDCPACVYFQCYINETFVKTGYGCAEDFERLCPHANLSKEYKNIIKPQIKDVFVTNPNYVLFGCSDSENCAEKIAIKYVFANLNEMPYFKKREGRCVYEEKENDVIETEYPIFFICFVIFCFLLILLFLFICKKQLLIIKNK